MAIVFPASPSNNDTFTVGSITYTYDGSKWIGLGVTPSDRLIEGSNSLEINASNELVWTGGTSKFGGVLQGDQRVIINGAGGKSGTSNTLLNYAGDGSTVTAALTADGAASFSDQVVIGSGSAANSEYGLIAYANTNTLSNKSAVYARNIGGGRNFTADSAAGATTFEVFDSGRTVLTTALGDRQLQLSGVEADLWLTSTGGSSTTWRILGSTGGSTHRFRIYDNTNSRDTLNIYDNGAVTKPANPAFCVRNTTSANAFLANSKATWDTVDINIGSFFDTTNHRFVCPVDGIYYFSCQMLSLNNQRLFTHLRRNEVAQSVPGSYTETYEPSTNTYQTATISMLLSCTATETISVWLGTQNGYGSNYANFSGYLVS